MDDGAHDARLLSVSIPCVTLEVGSVIASVVEVAPWFAARCRYTPLLFGGSAVLVAPQFTVAIGVDLSVRRGFETKKETHMIRLSMSGATLRPMSQLQKEIWSGTREQLSVLWTLSDDQRIAECTLWSHPFGWELRMSVNNGIVQTQVERTLNQVSDSAAAWRRMFLDAGWTDRAS
jgi:hypothetical protein